MKYKLGFNSEAEETKKEIKVSISEPKPPRKSLVRVYFPHRCVSYTYYNDAFDLKEGDNVFVEGKLEGYRGIVSGVEYNFKINLSDYKKVISASDCDVKGAFSKRAFFFATDDENQIPYKKIRTWYFPPKDKEEEIISSDDTEISLDYLIRSSQYTERVMNYTCCYFEIKNNKCRAILRGQRCHEVEFEIVSRDEEVFIKGLTCDCYQTGYCIHKNALIQSIFMRVFEYAEENKTYLAAINENDFCDFVLKNNNEKIIEIK